MIDFSHVSITRYDDYGNDLEAQGISSEKQLLQSRTYLTDLTMLGTGNLFPTQKGNDLNSTTGILNFAQAITHRLMTTKGEHPQDYSLGIAWNKYLGKAFYDIDLVIAELSSEIVTEVMRDIRTAEVTSIQIEFVDITHLNVHLVVLPVGETSYIELSFLASSGGG